ncbi:hypothetical protein E2C01_042131 [Portunus trituberculatus]|uniref:Uncharacterized protein n=1 Tax=Portunus trituberculatus TaxID=210409 RepID=A0A5B7FLP5_PORTR|nr:hypothetical protein [Portunus trituberculatus]
MSMLHSTPLFSWYSLARDLYEPDSILAASQRLWRFSNGMADEWNRLSNDAASAESLESFGRKIR